MVDLLCVLPRKAYDRASCKQLNWTSGEVNIRRNLTMRFVFENSKVYFWIRLEIGKCTVRYDEKQKPTYMEATFPMPKFVCGFYMPVRDNICSYGVASILELHFFKYYRQLSNENRIQE